MVAKGKFDIVQGNAWLQLDGFEQHLCPERDREQEIGIAESQVKDRLSCMS